MSECPWCGTDNFYCGTNGQARSSVCYERELAVAYVQLKECRQLLGLWRAHHKAVGIMSRFSAAKALREAGEITIT